MKKRKSKLAKKLGAKLVCQAPKAIHGFLGAANLANFFTTQNLKNKPDSQQKAP